MAAPAPTTRPMATVSATTARDRVLDAALRLFGERGYASSSIANIESAARLSPGPGSPRRHVASKEALPLEGVRRTVAEGAAMRVALQSPPTGPPDDLRTEAIAMVLVCATLVNARFAPSTAPQN